MREGVGMGKDTFKQLISRYDEGRLLSKVYKDLLGMSPTKALEDVENDSGYYIDELVSKLESGLPDEYTVQDLVRDAEEYHKGMIYWLTYVIKDENTHDVLTQVINMVKNAGKPLLLFTEDLAYVMGLEQKELLFDTRKQLACLVSLGEMSTGSSSYMRQYIHVNRDKLLRGAEEFNKVYSKDKLVTYGVFEEDMGYDLNFRNDKYTRKELELLYRSEAIDMYVRYLEIIEDTKITIGKTEAIDELKRMYPSKFKAIGDKCVVDLGDVYFTWIGDVRVISKHGNIGNLGETSLALKSDSKDIILKWLEYNDLYQYFA